MVAPTFDVRESNRAVADGATRADIECLRYRLEVVAVSALDVVQSAGGWLYDRVMAGWEVTALLTHGCDTLPLRILGVQAADPKAGFPLTAAKSHSLAVSAEAFSADARVREQVLACLDDRLTEVALWGDGWPLGVNRTVTTAQHVLSSAARRFKGYALAAAGMPCGSVSHTETLLCDVATGRRWMQSWSGSTSTPTSR